MIGRCDICGQAQTIDHEGWKKAHRTLFTMALNHLLTHEEYLEACRYWDDLYVGYRAEVAE